MFWFDEWLIRTFLRHLEPMNSSFSSIHDFELCSQMLSHAAAAYRGGCTAFGVRCMLVDRQGRRYMRQARVPEWV